MERALEEDSKDAIHEAGAVYRQIKMDDIETIKKTIDSETTLEKVVTNMATDISNQIVYPKTR